MMLKLPLTSTLIAAAYFGLAPRVAKRFYANMLFHPYPYPEGDYLSSEIEGIKYKDVFFQSGDGTKLHAWYFEQKNSPFTVLLSHGNTGNIAGRPALLAAILQTGASLFVYDYRGYGRSSGSPSVDGVISDACSSFDFLVNELAVPKDSIVLYGESLGAAVSCQLTLLREVRGMILQSGFASITKISKHHIPLMHVYPAALYPQPLLDNVRVLKKGHPPLLIVHGQKDNVVPFAHGQELFKSAVGAKSFAEFPEAGHSDIPLLAREKFVNVMSGFMANLESKPSI